jgi:hypothetical protein
MRSESFIVLTLNTKNYMPGINFINVLRGHGIFRTQFWRQKLQSFFLALKIFGAKIVYKKCECKMLMKLTPGR